MMEGDEKKKPNEIKEHESIGETSLHEAVQKRDFQLVQSLVMKGAKVNVLDPQGNTPLDLAFKIAKDDSKLKHLSKEEEAQHKNHEKSDQVLKFLCKSKNVPSDGNCLFWAVALAYLLPVKDIPDDFQNRLQNLFGDCDEATIASVLETLREYNPFSDIDSVSQNSTFNEKVSSVFRGRVVDYMRSNSEQFRDYFENDLEYHLSEMKKPGSHLNFFILL
jgi:hypothetical protein